MPTQSPTNTHFHYERRLMIATCLIMLSASLLFISREIKAQQNSTSVSAIVLPNAYNTRIKHKNFFESLSMYQKISLGTGTALTLSVGVAGYLLFTTKQKAHS